MSEKDPLKEYLDTMSKAQDGLSMNSAWSREADERFDRMQGPESRRRQKLLAWQIIIGFSISLIFATIILFRSSSLGSALLAGIVALLAVVVSVLIVRGLATLARDVIEYHRRRKGSGT